MSEEITGDWDDLVRRHDLRGRKVRIIVLDPQGGGSEPADENAWLKRLRSWADSHKPLGRPVNDSRESVYSGTLDDPR